MNVRVALAGFEPRDMALALGRSILALATLSVLLFNPDDVLFAYSSELPSGVQCDGLRVLSIWCLNGHAPSVSRIFAVIVLILVVVGYRPQWTCVPHWYVTFSVAASISVPNGGDKVAQIVTLLFIPACLNDRRRWHWTRPVSALPPKGLGVAYAAHITLRIQASIIYITAGVSKLFFAQWRDGTAMFNVFNDPNFGLAPGLLQTIAPALPWFPIVAAMTWGAVAAELVMGILVLGSQGMRYLALLLGGMLHGAIILLLGLPSFGLSMIALLITLCAGASGSGRTAELPLRTDETSRKVVT